MTTYNKQKFSQVMLNVGIKKQLDKLKPIIKKRIHIDMNKISYNDVIDYLIKNFQTKRIEYPIEQKHLVVIPLRPVSLSISSKLENKTKASFLLES